VTDPSTLSIVIAVTGPDLLLAGHDGATAEIWTCRPGSVVPVDDRTTFDLQSHRAVWTVTIPAYPIRS
jgi:hypothetical protein